MSSVRKYTVFVGMPSRARHARRTPTTSYFIIFEEESPRVPHEAGLRRPGKLMGLTLSAVFSAAAWWKSSPLLKTMPRWTKLSSTSSWS